MITFMNVKRVSADKTNSLKMRPAKTQNRLGMRIVWSEYSVRSVDSKGPNIPPYTGKHSVVTFVVYW